MLIFLSCKQSFLNVPKKKIVAYLPMWSMPYTPDWDKITHLCLAFGLVEADGNLNMEMILPYRTVIADAHEHGVKVLLSIGGGGSRHFSKALLDDNSRRILVNHLRINVDTLHLDGVDVDFEEWDGGELGAGKLDLKKRAALELFYKELRSAFGEEKLLSVAVNASWDTGKKGTYNCFSNSMHQYLDFVSLMIYDETGPWSGTHTGPHSSWDFFEKAIHHWLVNRELPKEKLVAGVPCYGYQFSKRGYAADAKGIGYKKIIEMYPGQDVHLKDSVGLLYYDGMATMQKKVEYVKKQGLGGIMLWEITQDSDNADKSLLNLIYGIIGS